MSEASTIVNDEEEESENSDVVIKIENDNISEKASTDEPNEKDDTCHQVSILRLRVLGKIACKLSRN